MTILVVAYPGSGSRPAGFSSSSTSLPPQQSNLTTSVLCIHTLSMSLLTDIFAQEEEIELELNPASGRCHQGLLH